VVSVLSENQAPFSEVAAHRASLEEAYMELTRDAVEYRAADRSAGADPAGPGVAR
jgi:ABC-2 type transport system ATP-binding protein